jgi:hypothetical protein
LIWLVGHGIQTYMQSAKDSNAEIARVLSDLIKVPGRAETICLNRWLQGVTD